MYMCVNKYISFFLSKPLEAHALKSMFKGHSSFKKSGRPVHAHCHYKQKNGIARPVYSAGGMPYGLRSGHGSNLMET